MANPTRLSAEVGGYVGKKWSAFIFSAGTEIPKPGNLYQNHRNQNLHYVYYLKKIAGNAWSADKT